MAEIELVMSKTIRRMVWCICLLGVGLDTSRAVARRKFGSSANSSLPYRLRHFSGRDG